MQTNLTALDAALSLMLGTFGSLIAAYLFIRGPTWLALFLTWKAERSKRAAQSRIKKLTEELDQLDHFEAHPVHFHAWIISRIARLVFGCTAMVIGCTAMVSSRIKIDTAGPYDIDLGFASSTIRYVIGGITFVILMIIISTYFSIMNLSDFGQRRKELREQIARLGQVLTRGRDNNDTVGNANTP